jgi:Prephenate dehydratase
MTKKEDIRKQIDDVDRELLTLLNRRQTLAKTIGELKMRGGKNVLDFQREETLISSLENMNPGPLSHEALWAIFREVISASREIQNPPVVTFLGPEATFSHLAAMKKFGKLARYAPSNTIHEVFLEVEKGKYNYGVVPVENSTEGAVNDTLDLLESTSLKVCGEVFLRISLDLASVSGQRKNIEMIYSLTQPYRQCRQWLMANFANVPIIEVASTAQAAQKAAENPNSAAIVSSSAASLYKLKVVEHGIEDQRGNTTHFFVMGKDSPGPTGNDATSIIFAVQNAPGALYNTLHPLQEKSINMTRIVSRPAKTEVWRYLFFVDIDGHQEDPKIKRVLNKMEKLSKRFKVLGSFPRMPDAEKLDAPPVLSEQ